MSEEREQQAIRRFLEWLLSDPDYRLCERGVDDHGVAEWQPEPWTVARCLALYEAQRQPSPAR